LTFTGRENRHEHVVASDFPVAGIGPGTWAAVLPYWP
jgi:hypothetical protein